MKKYVVGFVFDTPEMKNVLMLQRLKEPFAGTYNGIGGKIAEGESYYEAMFREAEEETSLSSDDFEHLKMLVQMNFPDENGSVQLNVFYGVLNENASQKVQNETQTPEGMLEWMSVEDSGILNVRDNRFAGEGNIAYFIHLAQLDYQFNR